MRNRTAGRICLVESSATATGQLADVCRSTAPLVIDVACQTSAAVAAACADEVVLIAAPQTEPALAPVVCEALSRVGPEPLVVLNRDLGDSDAWQRQAALCIPEARLPAQLALAGREGRGAWWGRISELADRVS
jgi:hypothetical protein